MPREPESWYAGRPPSGLERLKNALLAPAEAIYRREVIRRVRRAAPAQVSVPVICVGNVTAGGTGKTPVALDIGSRALAASLHPHFLLRGYGGRLKGPVRVDPAHHTARDVGDEALLLAERSPTWVSADRLAGATAAIAGGADLIVMDDGFQNFGLAKDVSLLVFDAKRGVGNGMLLPRGPLREPLGLALVRADALVAMNGPMPQEILQLAGDLPILAANVVSGDAGAVRGEKLVAFAGIGNPEKFFETLRAAGADLAATRGFPDHRPLSEGEAQALLSLAGKEGAALVTTSKDHVRLAGAPQGSCRAALRTRARRFDIRLDWETEGALHDLLQPVFDRARKAK